MPTIIELYATMVETAEAAFEDTLSVRAMAAAPLLEPRDAARLIVAMLVIVRVDIVLTDHEKRWSAALKIRGAAVACVEALCEKAGV